ncbi:Lipopolysaccharide export system protein LptC [Vibrio stylophorae]|uniref:Lipopolysaccharide export system protein LptC n=1 Tax=Vibrio stylophorae TaxID=659351 RepID=A0ABM8ZQF1_9VIBR|nr:LPS export ABC transporter periplasmic protein LptC [Vibrio stylophorae]CAH0532500.1 Lipopolysaccharide export system protein LptC [Vibrio stylophorae]
MSWQRFFIALLVIVCAGAGHYLFEKHWQSEVQVAIDIEKPIFVGDNIINKGYSAQGLLNYQVESKKLSYFAEHGNTEFEQPTLLVFRNGDQAEWRLTAKHATLTKEQMLILVDDVKLYNLLPNNAFEKMETDYLVLDLISKDFNTDQPTQIQGPGFHSRGNKMQGNLEQHVAELQDEVQGRYESFIR